VVYRADRFTYLCNSKSPLARWLVSRALRPFMPAALALKQAWDRVVSGVVLSGSGPP